MYQCVSPSQRSLSPFIVNGSGNASGYRATVELREASKRATGVNGDSEYSDGNEL